MCLPTEIMQHVYAYLAPCDFHAARRSCRTWFVSSLDYRILTAMLKRGGWWSCTVPLLAYMPPSPQSVSNDHLRLLSKLLSRECLLADSIRESAFTEVGFTDFGPLVAADNMGEGDSTISYTISQCGRYLLVSKGQAVFVYELNHTCSTGQSGWSLPLQRRQGLPLGLLRPVTQIACPRRVLSCSMDTSSGRNAMAFLMSERTGMVCDILPERLAISPHTSPFLSVSDSLESNSSSATSPGVCVCKSTLASRAVPVEYGSRSVYRNVCHADDPPRSVALCPRRNCVAFGCSSGIELH